VEVNDQGCTRGKLAPNWEGPYRIVHTIRDCTYVLARMDGKVLPRTSQILNLRKFYV
ncbi:hypothetical protein BHM03_00037444, partial [Ensete ventricosum]